MSTGCQWRAIPKDLPPRGTMYDYFDLRDGTLDRIHDALYIQCREQARREPSSPAAIINSQGVKSAEKGRREQEAPTCHARWRYEQRGVGDPHGYDAGNPPAWLRRSG